MITKEELEEAQKNYRELKAKGHKPLIRDIFGGSFTMNGMRVDLAIDDKADSQKQKQPDSEQQ